MLPNQTRACIHAGQTVDIVLKADQATGKLTRGVVKDILTNSREHYRGIKTTKTDKLRGSSKLSCPFFFVLDTKSVVTASQIVPIMV